MSTIGCKWKKSLGGQRDIRRSALASGNANGSYGGVPAAASTTFNAGDPLKFTNGKLAVAGTTDLPLYVCDIPVGQSLVTAATDEKVLPVINVQQQVFEMQFTPLIDAGACGSNSTATQAIAVLTAGSSSDLVGGLVYSHSTDEVRVITANTYSGGNVTLTVAGAFAKALTTGDKISVVPFGFGSTAVRLTGTTGAVALDATIAGASGGHANIYSVNMKKKIAEVFFA